MSTHTIDPTPTPSANLVQIGTTIEDTIQARLAEERARLEREAGLVKRDVHHFKRPVERPFTADQRPNTTLLFGGLTWKHEKLVHGALEGLGYRAEAVPTPDCKVRRVALAVVAVLLAGLEGFDVGSGHSFGAVAEACEGAVNELLVFPREAAE